MGKLWFHATGSRVGETGSVPDGVVGVVWQKGQLGIVYFQELLW